MLCDRLKPKREQEQLDAGIPRAAHLPVCASARDRVLRVRTRAALLLAALLAAHAGAEELTNGTVVARVNGEEITRGAIEDYVWKIIPATTFHRKVSDQKFAELRAEGLEKLSITILAAREARAANMDVSKAVDSAIADAVAAVERKGRKFDAILAERKETKEHFRAEIERAELATAYIQRETVAKVQISEDEIRKQFDANPATYVRPEAIRVNHILIRIPPEQFGVKNLPQQKLAAQIQKRAERGESFEDLANLFKEEIGNAGKVDTGFVHRGGMLREVEDVAFKLKIGEVSQVLPSIYGLNIVKLVDRKPPEAIPFEKVHDAIKESLRKKKVEDLRKELDQRLKAGAKIEILWDPASDRMLAAPTKEPAKP